MSNHDPDALAARNLLAARLTERHDLDPLDAHTAVSRVHYGLPTEHKALVRHEASAFLDEAYTELKARIVEALAPMAAAWQALGEAIARTVAQLPHPPARSPQPRPAWQSPYGPPRKGHRR
ncbi:hypothetical protein [Streptomyces sp. NPDC048551]|uniref:hypothetical protein n=1 Tax=Streptomyces sp. NPDC048551 TaxID=3155758 RepID=UPI003420DFF8